MDGLILIDKPVGWTSFDVVGKIRGLIERSPQRTDHKKRFSVGHTGTLDPLASGLLVLLLGRATKYAPQLTKLDKTYEVTMRLGMISTTGDEEGTKTTVSDERPGRAIIEETLPQFTGLIQQTPPPFSAIKVHGKRAYQLARSGRTPALQPRTVHVYWLSLRRYAYPNVDITVRVSSGTYIRSLVADIGRKLGTGAYTTTLRRTHVGKFQLTDALAMERVGIETLQRSLIDVRTLPLNKAPAA
ncbi:MAG TPA: tRNA pseudouridine(55) synthase TruB [Candidatus Saccharimonadales bacterium]|nr:tRNA pseudouridine(55) synthase TruB [Candidatus Saccharimonadales bacterium]